MIEALIWDVDGTLAETERDGHRVAYNRAFEMLRLEWHWDEPRYGELLRVSGGRARLLADMATRPDAPPPAERESLARLLHRMKTQLYAERVAEGSIQLRPGVRLLVEQAAARGLRQAVATTTSRANVEALLTHHFGSGWGRLFQVAVCGEDLAAGKPDPEVYHRVLAGLDIGPLATLAIEDAYAGARAARAADVPVVVARSAYFAADMVEGAIAVGPGLHTRRGWRPAPAGAAEADGPVSLDDLVDWHAGMDFVSHYD
jgi:HAD superfamily hydrolase (TIGR01509 family)